MTSIAPPRPKGQRSKPTQQVTMYELSVAVLDRLVECKNTTRVEYLRWLVECAEAGLVGPTPGADFDSEGRDLVVALLDGQMTQADGVNAVWKLVNRVCIDQRNHSEAEWSREQNQ